MEFSEILHLINDIAEAVISVICAALCVFRAFCRKDVSLFFYLLTGFFSCVFLCEIYYLLTYLVADYPYVISTGDLSWVGAIVFLITAALDSKNKLTANQKEAAKKYRVLALTAPAVCILFNAVYIRIYPELTANYLLYGIPTTILAHISLWLFLSDGKGGVGRPYYGATLLWIAVQLFGDLFSSLGTGFGFGVHFLVCRYLLTMATTGIYLAVRNGSPGESRIRHSEKRLP